MPSQGVKVDREKREIYAPSLKLNYSFRNDFEKVNQMEVDEQYAHVSVTIPEIPMIEPKVWTGMQRGS
jgi:putative transposase